jgi:glycerol-3-phosphate dehydrogenase (NAD(P)+)
MLAVMLARKREGVTLWARTPQEAEALHTRRENPAFLPQIPLPPALKVTASLEEVLSNIGALFLVVPAHSMRENLRRAAPYIPPQALVVSATKGLEVETALRMSQVIAEELPSSEGRVCALSGPNLAREIAAGRPAASVVASGCQEAARWVQTLLMSPAFRPYTHEDLVGVELCGALKNVIAIAAGAADGFEVGNNAKAALVTRGLAEITRLGVAAGANPLTFAGLAGVGDLIATCTSPQSRNHYVGVELARGRRPAEIQAGMRMVAEGIHTAQAARKLARSHGVEMPLSEQIYQVLFEGKEAREVVMELMLRHPRGELEGLKL